MEKTIKKQKIAIIILSILLGIFIIVVIGTNVFYIREKQSYTISMTDYYRNPETQTSICYIINITCQEDKIISVNDFEYKQGEHEYQTALRIVFNDETYTKNESFIVKAYDKNKLIIYTSLLNIEEDKLFYKLTPIKLGQSVKFG